MIFSGSIGLYPLVVEAIELIKKKKRKRKKIQIELMQ
jgi:hypothetical protein